MDSSCNPCEVTAIPHFEDPLKHLLPLCFPNSPTPCENAGPLTVRHGTPDNPKALKDGANLQPGIYYGGIEISDGSMALGIYIMAGGGFKVNSNSDFIAKGVFIYNTNDPDCLSCSIGVFKPVIVNTNGAANFSAMSTGPYTGLLFFQDRANTLKAGFNTNDKFGEDTVYFPSAHVDLNPNHDVTIQIISDTIKVNNNGIMTAHWDGDDFYQVPSARIALTG